MMSSPGIIFPKLLARECVVRIFQRIVSKLFNADLTFSQEGEDKILMRLLETAAPLKSNGFYVDIGANHPRRFSNSYAFYLKGWSGICVEPNPELSKKFSSVRPRDKFINCGVGSQTSISKFFMFNDDALNTFDENLVNWRLANTRYSLINSVPVNMMPLSEILSKNISDSRLIDFLNVDVEGLDLEVLKSNDWTKFRPIYVLAENIAQVRNPVIEFLESQQYEVVSKTKNTLIFRDAGSGKP